MTSPVAVPDVDAAWDANPLRQAALRLLERDQADVVRAHARLAEDVVHARRVGLQWGRIGAAIGLTESGARAIARRWRKEH